MAITRVQQTQISGSLSQDDNLEAGSGLGAKANLKGDLDALRSQIKRIVGGANWYTALSGSQDLADIYAAVRVTGANSALQGTLSVSGNSTLASADIGGGFGSTGVTISAAGGIQANGALEVGGASMLSGSLTVLGASQFAAVDASGAVALASTLSAGASTLASVGVTGAATVGTTLGVAGASSFASTVGVTGALTAASPSNQFNALAISGSAGLSVSSGATIGTTLGVTGAATLSSTLGVTGAATLSSTLGVAGTVAIGGGYGSTGITLSDAGVLQMNGALTVDGASSLAAVGASGAATFASTLGVTGALTAASPSNVMNGLSVTGSNGLSVSSNLSVLGNATVNGDLYVKGTTTYIQTDNMIVKDAFIYLATGSAGTTDSGLVFMKGAGASFDLILGQDNGDGEFIFAKQAHNASLDSPADLNASALVPAWMGVAKIGSYEGTLRGALSSSAGEFSVKAEAGVSLKLTALGDEAFDLAVDGEQATFDALFTATSIIGAIMEAKNAASSAGFFQKGTLSSANVVANVLTFSSIGTLSSAVQKNIDVFLNGVLLAPIFDVASVTTTTATLNSAIGDALMVDDVITVCLRSTTA